MNAEQITAYLAATNDAKKWKSKLNKQLNEEIETAAIIYDNQFRR